MSDFHQVIAANEDHEALLKKVYHNAIYFPDVRTSYRKDGSANKWALDMRIPLARSELLAPICLILCEKLDKLGIKQIAGRGLGSFFLIGGIVAMGKEMRGALLRDYRKMYGFREIVEGGLDKTEPVVIVDDLLSTGQASSETARILKEDGYQVHSALFVLRFGWQDHSLPVSYEALGSLYS